MAVGYTPVDDDLYREIILDHYRNPRHHQTVSPADRVIEANNPLCGDEIDLSYRIDGGTVTAIGFTGRGCSISQAWPGSFAPCSPGTENPPPTMTTSATSRRSAASGRTRCESNAPPWCGMHCSKA
jgi:hypothetical protein